MAGTHVSLTVNDAAFSAELENRAKAETGRLVPRLGEYLKSSTQRRFQTQTAPDGTPWAPLKRATVKRKKYNPDKILTLRGYLRGGIRWQALNDSTVQAGTNSEYAAIQQFGGEVQQPARQTTARYRSVAGRILFAGRKHKRATEKQVTIPAHTFHIPARPFFGISAADDREIREIIMHWVIGDGKG